MSRIRRLLAAGPETFMPYEGGRNPLYIIIMLAVECYHGVRRLSLPDVVKLFIDLGIDVNYCDADDVTPVNFLMNEV